MLSTDFEQMQSFFH